MRLLERCALVNCSASDKKTPNEALNERDALEECTQIDSLTISSTPEVMGKTTFLSEACESVSVLGQHYKKPMFAIPQKDLQDIAKYYARPRLVDTGTLGSSRALENVKIYTPNGLFGYAAGGVSRIAGAYLFRTTVVFTLQVAATPFHQGLVTMAWQYYPGNNSSYRYQSSLSSVTALPHVRLDVSTTTMVQLRVPFMSPYDALPIGEDSIDYGRLAIVTSLPVEALAGVSAPTYRVLAHLEDLELFGVRPTAPRSYISSPPPVPLSVVQPSDPVVSAVAEPPVVQAVTFSAPPEVGALAPTAPSVPPTKNALKRAATLTKFPAALSIIADTAKVVEELRALNAELGNNANYTAADRVDVEMQSGVGGVEKELDDEAHPFSSAISSSATTLKWIAKGIPSLSSIATPAAWFLRKSAGALRYFGYARPPITDPPHRVLPTSSCFEHNLDVPSAAVPFSFMSENHLPVSTDFSSTDVDEMSLSFMAGQYTQLALGRLGTSSLSSALIWGTFIRMDCLWLQNFLNLPITANLNWTIPSGSTLAFQPTTPLWLASMFKYWRGGFRFRVTFAKTKIHAGRVAMTYIPSVTPTITNLEYPEVDATGVQTDGYSTIFDLRDDSVFEFDVPYTSFMPYLTLDECMGSLSLVVVDPLVGSSMVAGTITYMVEIKCLPDFKFGLPNGCKLPYLPTTTATIVEQSGRVVSVYDDSISAHTMGEDIVSAKQLISIPCRFPVVIPSGNSSGVIDVAPWWYSPPLSVTTANFGMVNSYGAQLVRAFTYVKGSTEAHLYGATSQSFLRVRAFLHDSSTTNTNDFSVIDTAPFAELTDGVLHARVPAYQRSVRILHCEFNDSYTWDPTYTTSFANGKINWPAGQWRTIPTHFLRLFWSRFSGTVAANVVFSRQASDDAAMAHYIGPPTVVYTTTSAFSPKLVT